ncbi:MAG: cation:dicarboxylase symporter family transporter [Bacteroidota bacterium]
MKKINITWRIFIGMMLGIILGYFLPQEWGESLQLLSKVFLRLIKMIIGPLVFSTLVVGIAKLGDFKVVGRIGIKTLGYFYFATILSLIVGLLAVNIFRPGEVIQSALPAAGTDTGITATKMTLEGFLNHVIPQSFAEAMATNEILQIVIFSIFFGVAVGALGEQGKIVIKGMDALAHVMFKVVGYVMEFAPFGVLGAIAAVVAKQGLSIFVEYAYLIVCFFAALIFFLIVVLWIICIVMKIPYIQLLKHIKEPLLLSFSTASSEASFPQTIAALEKFGCSNRVVSFVLPLGYSFNLDGSMMYMTFATAYIAQRYGIHLTLQDQITMMLTLMITSKGIAGVPRASLVVIAGTMALFNLPAEGLALLLGIDQILDMGRSATSVAGNAVATCVVSKWEGEFDAKAARIPIEAKALV